jgi:hypothetical protein
LQKNRLRPIPFRRFSLALEQLEGRWVPSTSSWHDLEPNDTPAQSQDLAVIRPLDHTQIAGTIATTIDADWYRFQLSDAGRATLQMNGVGTASLFRAEAHDPSQLAPVVAGEPLAAGTYFVSVNDPAGGVGAYQLDFELTPLLAPTDLGTLQPADLQKTVSVRREADGRTGTADLYQFTVTEQNLYLITVRTDAGSPVARVALADGAGNALTPGFTMSDPRFRVLILQLEPGSYHLQVSGWDAADAGQVAYALQITAGIHENPTPLPAAPSPGYRLRLTTNDPPATSPAVSAAPLAPALRLSLPSAANEPEPLRFVSTARVSGALNGAIGGDLPRPNGSLAGLAAGPLGVAPTGEAATPGALRLTLPTSPFAGLDPRGGYAGGDASRDSFGAATGLEWAGQAAGQMLREWVFQSIHWLTLPQIHPLTEAVIAELPQVESSLVEFDQDTAATDSSRRAMSMPEVVMPASPRRIARRQAEAAPSAGPWLALGLLAATGGLLPLAPRPQRRTSPSLADSRGDTP